MGQTVKARQYRLSARMRALPVACLTVLLDGYRLVISPLLGQHCRFHPSCSRYARDALQAHGLVTGLSLALRRILRCHPWHEGGIDPVPAAPLDRLAGRPR